ncbi:MAG TPA: hypothetical protein VKF41_04640 [Bryobacteraceae bacterium]|nr:hypothetical protein [Bryobacteraceae bacterium]
MKDNSARQPASYGRRAASYWFCDGLPEIFFGTALVIIAALMFLWRLYARKPWVWFDWMIVAAGFILYYLMERRVLDFLKSHLTYPRTGYVQPPEEVPPRVQTITTLSLRPDPPAKENATSFQWRTVMLVFWFCFSFMLESNPLGRWVVPVVVPALAVALYAVNRRSEHPYRWWSALILALAGLVFAWVDAPANLQRPLPLFLAGAWLVAQGACTLVHYLRANPDPQAAEGARA